MSLEEITRIARIAVSLGISRIKLTGGEPLMRGDIRELVKAISLVPGLKDLSLTTNGILLGSNSMAKDLHENGLKRVNISLPSLNPQTYSKLTSGKLEAALVGVKAAVEAGFSQVKINMVVLKDVNIGDIPEMIEYAKRIGVILQLIELDPINVGQAYYDNHYSSMDTLENTLRQKALTVETRPYMHNRRIYHLPGVTVEVVHPIDNSDFCLHCTRMRVTSDGKLKPCLMRNDNLTDVLTPIRHGASDEQIKQLFMTANMIREPFNKVSTKITLK